jgi:hypothetical protein
MQFDANTEYKKSVEYKAKAGIDRLNNKSWYNRIFDPWNSTRLFFLVS